MDEFDRMTAHRLPTPTRPLLGLTVLVVEDSRYACDALRLLCLRSGARIRRADCLRSARRHLQLYRPSVVIVDMGLPDGSGAELIEELAGATPRVSVLLGISGDSFVEDIAIAAGADGFLSKPLNSLADFQQAVLTRLPADQQPSGPRVLPDDTIKPDPVAYRDDLCHAADTLSEGKQDEVIEYVAQFLAGIARSAQDMSLANAAEAITNAYAKGKVLNADVVRLNQMVQDRLEREPAI
ncbi:response regulator [uncultured Shimia sp.]|uniref:response regulator n=1 Tax=uncultured Shimia sp. TaxID=573152 RepID=UPI0026279806|nr:response regulator [uncultured Shimia sp.]